MDSQRAEVFSFKKFVAGPFTGSYWGKTVSLGVGLTILLFIGYSVYSAYFKPSGSQEIRAESGSNVTVIQQNERKRIFIPFVEVFVEQRSTNELNTGIRAGLRFEF